MILVVGLGNPGPRYAETRHNIGFRVVDSLLERAGGASKERFHGLYATVDLSGTSVGLLKPMTYMNESGRSVQPAAQFLKVHPSSILVVYDELDLAFGEVRLKSGGGEAGHRGLKSITQAIGGETKRLRIGIGRPPPEFRGSVPDFVLQRFSPAEQVEIGSLIDRAVEAVTLVATRGIEVAMNATNQRKPR